MNGHFSVVQFIVENLLQPIESMNMQDSDGRTPLHEAAFRGYARVVRYLVRAGADTSIRHNGDGDALSDAVSADKFEVIFLFIIIFV